MNAGPPAVFLFMRDPFQDGDDPPAEGVVLLAEIAAIVPWERGAVICLKTNSHPIYSNEPPEVLIKRWLAALIEDNPGPFLPRIIE